MDISKLKFEDNTIDRAENAVRATSAAMAQLNRVADVKGIFERTALAQRAISDLARNAEALDAVQRLNSATNNLHLKFLESTAASRRLADAVSKSSVGGINSPISQISLDISTGMSRTLLRALEFSHGFESTATGQAFRKIDAIAAQYRFLESSGLQELARQAELAIGSGYGIGAASIAHRLGQLKSPWLLSERDISTASALARVQGVGHLLDHAASYDRGVSRLLRTSLGDWRDFVAMPEQIHRQSVRVNHYAERGFDSEIVDVPDDVFSENLHLSGFVFRESDAAEYGGEDDEALIRTNQMHDVFQRLEIAIRRFICNAMTAQFGEDWMRHRISPDLVNSWKEKRERDPRRWPLIHYADFTDYEKIMTRRDNWREVFAHVFECESDLRESLRRLYPCRVATMHARPLGRDDLLLAAVEARRLIRSLRRFDDGI